MFITAEELLAGKEATYDVEIPESILRPGMTSNEKNGGPGKKIKLRPLTVKDIQLIAKAAKDDEVLTSALMIQKAVVEPQLKQNQIADLHGGLVSFLVDHINHISGLSTTEEEMDQITDSPIVQAFFLLAKEFNWTPEQVREMTVGQIVGYLELLNQTKRAIE
jgi:hypothetical protein